MLSLVTPVVNGYSNSLILLLIIDCHRGDAVIEISDDLSMAASISAIIHCLIMQVIVAEVAIQLNNAGVRPPFF